MNSPNIDQEIESIKSRFKAAGIDVEPATIRAGLMKLIDYRVPLSEAVKTVTTSLRKQYNLPFEGLRNGESVLVPIASIKEDNKWVTVRGKVVQLWDPNSEAIAQTGLIGDESGIIKFTIFSKSVAKLGALLEEGASYELSNVISSEYQGQMSIKINANSAIKHLAEDIKASRQTLTITGLLTSVLRGSGLIKRCPECSRKLTKGSCGEHGRVDGIFDLRIMACLHDSVPATPPQAYELIINADVVEKVTGVSLDKAKEMATEALDAEIVTQTLTDKVLFRYFKITGSQLQTFFLVETMEPVDGIAAGIAQEVKKLVASYTGGN